MPLADTTTSRFLDVTELAGEEVSQEQVERLCHCYYWATTYCAGRDVLDVARGSGPGLRYLAPRPLRPLSEYALSAMRRDVRRACADVTAIVGLMADYRDWALAQAGRSAKQQDRVFPLAYATRPPSESSILAVHDFWWSLDIGSRS